MIKSKHYMASESPGSHTSDFPEEQKRRVSSPPFTSGVTLDNAILKSYSPTRKMEM